MNQVAVLCGLLQKMRPEVRRKVIATRLQGPQRLALETHMLARRTDQERPPLESTAARQVQGLCSGVRVPPKASHPEHPCKLRGVGRCAAKGKIHGYYAMAGINNLLLRTRIHRELEDAVRDHIVLMQIVEQVRRDVPGRGFPQVLRSAVAEVLRQQGLEPKVFLRSFHVFCSALHWIGRALYVYRDHLDGALGAWQRLDQAKGRLRLFKEGGRCTADYTPERSADQWARMRAAYVALRLEGGGQHANDLECWLQKLEAVRRPAVEKVVSRWRQASAEVDEDGQLLRRVERVLDAWERAVAARRPQQRRDRKKRQRDDDTFERSVRAK